VFPCLTSLATDQDNSQHDSPGPGDITPHKTAKGAPSAGKTQTFQEKCKALQAWTTQQASLS
jgi:hypothetical protein